jgi:predicted ester cyclase
MTSQEQENKALVRRFWDEVYNRGNYHVADELLAPNFVNRDALTGEEIGWEDLKREIAEQAASSSDLHFSLEEQIAEGDKVVSRVIGSGSVDQRELEGVTPTGVRITIENISINRVVEGKIVEERIVNDSSPFWKQRMEQERIERERVEQGLQVARSIQQASLPEEVTTLEGWQISPFYQPAREVGGDFYDFHFLSEGRLGLAVGDATGNGVPAALVMSTTCGMLQAVSEASDSISPGEVLSRVNETLFSRIPSNMFVTCFYGVLDPESATFTYANAGHDLPYLWHGGAAEELRARGMPLGLMPGMSYEEKATVLDAGETALFYSDGLVEAHDPEGEMFGFPRLQGLIAEHGKQERSLGDSLLEELYSFVGAGWEQEDDITLLTLKRSEFRN